MLRPRSPRCREWNQNYRMDPYQILQIRQDATLNEIRHAYQRLALLHHPVRRRKQQPPQSQQQYQQHQNQMHCFEILAACYETLMDVEARRRCDVLLQEQETATLHRTLSESSRRRRRRRRRRPKENEVKVVGRMRHDDDNQHPSDRLGLVVLHTMPSLAEISLCNSTDESLLTQEDVWRHVTTDAQQVDGQEQVEIVYSFEESKDQGDPCPTTTLRPLRILNSQQSSWDEDDSTNETLEDIQSIDTSSPSTDEDDTSETHYTSAEIDRMFGGPLQLLFRARRWKVFRDPFEVFAEVFENPLYGHTHHHHHHHHHHQTFFCTAPGSTTTQGFRNAWQIPTKLEKLPSEHVNRRTTIHRTRRVVEGHEIVRTAVVRIDPRTKQRHVTISVTRDDGSFLEEEEDSPRNDWFYFLDSLCVGSSGNGNCFCFDFSVCT
ncbi:hypothetical protein FisN_19Lh270 [Fistulifera solaris]|uniref:J domain-containing protein n=1 Tax=Fistulifera solaris TaxID=1519565 RepID=A0A1Z5K7K9_FISSO|nr:hypothetical protein FisN_19Lh270 [Fistulifera solaris]|eukprot:GAX22206.1 hypothetical protein FisN_19Lh270 [Fistulifera solaris]